MFLLVASLSALLPVVSAQAAFGYWACVLYCPRTAVKFTPPVGGSCRTDTNCALAFAGFEGQYLAPCGASSFADFASTAQYQAIPFTDFSYCNNYQSFLNSAQSAFQSNPTSETNVQASQNASCSCNTVVSTLLSTVQDQVIPSGSSNAATAVCTFLADKAVAKLTDKALTICKSAVKISIAGSFCNLIMKVVDTVIQPAKDLVVNLCSSVLQSLLDVFGLSSTLNSLLADIRSKGDQLVNSASNLFCGSSICTSASQSSCSKSSTGKGLQSVIDNGVSLLCKIASGGTPDCFPRHATTSFCNGTKVIMSQLGELYAQGEQVSLAAADGTCSPLLLFTNFQPAAWTLIVRLDLKPAVANTILTEASLNNLTSHASLPATVPQSSHFHQNQSGNSHSSRSGAVNSHKDGVYQLYVSGSNYLPTPSHRLLVAESVKVGDMLLSGTGEPLVVVHKAWEYHHGLYHFHLGQLKEYVIDGVQVSQYTRNIHPALAAPALAGVEAISRLGFPVRHTWLREMVAAAVYHPSVSFFLRAPGELPLPPIETAAGPRSTWSTSGCNAEDSCHKAHDAHATVERRDGSLTAQASAFEVGKMTVPVQPDSYGRTTERSG